MRTLKESLCELRKSLDEVQEPSLPSTKVPKGALGGLAHIMQLDGTGMLVVAKALQKGQVAQARVKLRQIHRRLDQALAQLGRMK